MAINYPINASYNISESQSKILFDLIKFPQDSYIINRLCEWMFDENQLEISKRLTLSFSKPHIKDYLGTDTEFLEDLKQGFLYRFLNVEEIKLKKFINENSLDFKNAMNFKHNILWKSLDNTQLRICRLLRDIDSLEKIKLFFLIIELENYGYLQNDADYFDLLD